MTRCRLFPKQKSSLNQSTNNDNNTTKTSSSQNSILPCYSTVNSNPNDLPLNSQSVLDENECPVKVYSITNYPNYPFPLPSS